MQRRPIVFQKRHRSLSHIVVSIFINKHQTALICFEKIMSKPFENARDANGFVTDQLGPMFFIIDKRSAIFISNLIPISDSQKFCRKLTKKDQKTKISMESSKILLDMILKRN